MEVLGAGKALVVIVNDKLMDNHQVELAERLAEDRHLVYGTVASLGHTIANFAQEKDSLEPYTQPEGSIFSNFINQLMKV